MATVGKFEYGSKTLDVNAGRYSLGESFRPPGFVSTAPVDAGSMVDVASLEDDPRQRRNWEIPIHIEGSSVGEVRRGLAELQDFLMNAGGEEKLYFAFRDHNLYSFEPTWGQLDAYLRYEILRATIDMRSAYQITSAGGNAYTDAVVRVVSKGVALGKRQRVGQGAGGILLDYIGTTGGKSRGVSIPEDTTNEVRNPIFGHSTWNSGWTDAASLQEAENTDHRYVLFGFSSAKLTASDTVNISYTTTVTAANTNTHAFSYYAKLPDGGTVSSTHTVMNYAGSGLTESYEDVGDGWYRVKATAAGVASSQNFQIIVNDGYTVYVDGVQMEENPFPTALCHGDMMGCSWAGTAHDSDSSRTAARILVEDVPDIAQGTIRVIWKAPATQDDYSGTPKFELFADNNGNFSLSYNTNGTDEWIFTTDGYNNDQAVSAGAGADDFTAGEVIIFHCTWKPGTGTVLELFKNGASLGGDQTYAPPTAPTSLYIGTNEASGAHAGGTIMGFTIFDRAMTTAEVLADYNNVVEITNDDQVVDEVPWEWTKDGDSTVDSCIESGKDIQTVFGGVTGSTRAKTRALVEFTGGPAFLSVIPLDQYYTVEDVLFHDVGGTVTGATDCGGEVDSGTWGTTHSDRVIVGLGNEAMRRLSEMCSGKDMHTIIRLPTIAGSDNKVANLEFRWNANHLDAEKGEITTGDTGVHALPPFTMYRDLDLFRESGFVTRMNSIGLSIEGSSVGAGTGTVQIDYFCLFPEPYTKVDVTTDGVDYFILEGLRGKETSDNTYKTVRDDVLMDGNPNGIDLFPNVYNLVQTIASATIANTWTWNQVYITPRYALL